MTWMQISGGRTFDLANPRAEDVCPNDIALGLSRINRFLGRTDIVYNVAQHSLLVSLEVERQTKPRRFAGDHHRDLPLAALLHDAHEAYVGDWTRPLLDVLHPGARDALNEVKSQIDLAVSKRFDFPHQLFSARLVCETDAALLATEKRDLMACCSRNWDLSELPLGETIEPVCQGAAEAMFLNRLDELLASRP